MSVNRQTIRKWKGSRFCWECGKKLMTKRGGGYTYKLVQDPLGNPHRVHLNCPERFNG